MKKSITSYIIFTLLLLAGNTSYGQTLSKKLAVAIQVDSFTSTSVKFSWDNFSIQSTEISRKSIQSNNWSVIASNITSATYTDATIVAGVEYEYQFKVTTGAAPSLAYGYIAFGVNIPAKNSRGKMLLVVDDRFTSALADELSDLQKDLISDGWQVVAFTCSKDSTPQYVKTKLDSINMVENLDAIYLIGHIPVPYSGAIRPDGHSDHFGAWPTDLYYVTDASLWTDIYYNFSNSSRPINSNLYQDGKYDNAIIPAVTDCSISRVDFYDMPQFSNSELELLSNYLKKVSEYKKGVLEVNDAGIIDDNLINYGGGLAVSGEMSFPSLTTTTYQDSSIDYLVANPTKWYMANSFSNDTSMSNVASISTLDAKPYQGVFSLLFGSYFGDWNTQNNYMRGILANGKMLTSCWAGRPNWFFHHMGLNNPIALSAKKSIDNGKRRGYVSTAYENAGSSPNGVHMALMGDLSLRNSYVEPVREFGAEMQHTQVMLTWKNASISAGISFLVYSSSDSLSGYTLLHTASGADSSYVDINGTANTYYYIKVVELDTTLSGSYFNNSVGVFTSVGRTVVTLPVDLIDFSAEMMNDESVLLSWSTASELNNEGFEVERRIEGEAEFTALEFVTGNGTTSSTSNYGYIDNQIDWKTNVVYYRLKQLDFDGNYVYSPIVVVLRNSPVNPTIYPNPTKNTAVIALNSSMKDANCEFVLRDMLGAEVTHSVDVSKGFQEYRIDVRSLRSGTYMLEILVNNQKAIKRLVVSR